MPDVYVKAQTAMPTSLGEWTSQPIRATGYGDIWSSQANSYANAQALEGCHFVAMGVTPTTSILTPNSTSLTETAPCCVLYNASNTKTYVLDFIRILNTVIATGSTDVQAVFAIDNTNRYTSGGTGLTVLNSNMASPRDSNANCVFGNITASAASGSRRFVEYMVVKGTMAAPATLAKDVYAFNFGQTGTSMMSAFANATANISSYSFNLGPIALGPGHSFLMYLYYGTAASGSSYVPVISWFER